MPTKSALCPPIGKGIDAGWLVSNPYSGLDRACSVRNWGSHVQSWHKEGHVTPQSGYSREINFSSEKSHWAPPVTEQVYRQAGFIVHHQSSYASLSFLQIHTVSVGYPYTLQTGFPDHLRPFSCFPRPFSFLSSLLSLIITPPQPRSLSLHDVSHPTAAGEILGAN